MNSAFIYKHPVGLVEYQIGNPVQFHNASLKEVDESTRSSDKNFHSLLDEVRLLASGDTAVDGEGLEFARPSKLLALDLNLHGKLTRGGKHKHDGTLSWLENTKNEWGESNIPGRRPSSERAR